jgi:hypothetical protein
MVLTHLAAIIVYIAARVHADVSWRAMEWCNGACTRHAVIIIYVAARGRAVADVQLACDEVVPWCSLVLPPSLVTLLLFTCMCVYVSCACATRGELVCDKVLR